MVTPNCLRLLGSQSIAAGPLRLAMGPGDASHLTWDAGSLASLAWIARIDGSRIDGLSGVPASLRAAIAEIDLGQRVLQLRTMDEIVASSGRGCGERRSDCLCPGADALWVAPVRPAGSPIVALGVPVGVPPRFLARKQRGSPVCGDPRLDQ